MARSSKAKGDLGNGMKVTEYIPNDCIISNLKAKDKIHAIKELTRHLHKKGQIDDIDVAIERVVERESFDSTGIGAGIAVPHARINTIDGLVCALGRKREGMEYRSVDGKPVHLIFLILYPPSDSHKYLYFIASISRLVQDENLVEKLMEAATSKSMYKVLNQANEALMQVGSAAEDASGAGSGTHVMKGSNSDLMLLIRLMRMESLKRGEEGSTDTIEEKINQVRSCISSRVLAHYDRLSKRVKEPVVAVEEEVCLGCNLQLSSAFAQELRDTHRVTTCPNCTRFLYAI